ncbi:MAG: Lrp/AsnC family transcriptional regulator, partial [Candidatus Thorarchaeota archaeon]
LRRNSFILSRRMYQEVVFRWVNVLITAFIMAKIESAKARDVLIHVRELEEVEEAHLIYGAYDLLIKGGFKTPESLSSFVVDTLRKVDGVKDTVTNVCAASD